MTALNFPIGPADGDRYEDYFFDASDNAWRLDPFPLETGPTGPQGEQGRFTVSPTAPVDPEEGDIWFYSEDGTSFIRYEDEGSAQWVEFGNLSQGPAGADGADGATGPEGPRGLSDTPAGVIVPWSSNTPPENWLMCDGSLVNKDEYPSLFGVIGYTYGNDGEDPDFFALPNLSGRVVVGLDGTDASFDILGEVGGVKAHTLTTAEIPSHTHAGNPHTHPVAETSNAGAHSHSGSTSSAGEHGHTSSIGSAGAHSHNGSVSGVTATNATNHTHSFNSVNSVTVSTANRGNNITSGNPTVVTAVNASANSLTTGGAGSGHSHSFSDTFTTSNHDGHSHSISITPGGSHSHNFNTSNTGGHTHNVTLESQTATVQNTGGELAHNNLQPYITLNYIIKSTGAEVAGEPEIAVRVTALENENEVTTLTVNTIVLDFTSGNGLLSRTVTSNVVFTVFAYKTGAERTIRLVGDASLRSLTFPEEWRFLGVKPTELAENAVGVLNLRCFGPNEANCVAQWGVSVT